MFFNDTYSDVSKRFKNWLEVNSLGGSFITDLALDYLNRAVASLALEAPRGWDYLTKDRVELTLGGDTGLECSLPEDCGVLLKVYTDPTATHKPTIYYTKDGKVSTGFRWVGAFSTEGISTTPTGSTYSPVSGYAGTKIKFFYAPIATPYAKYQTVITPFTGVTTKVVGETTYNRTEYCPFPGDLILLEAQRIRLREKGQGKEWATLKPEYTEFLKKFKAQHQNVAEDPQIEILDYQGVPVLLPEYGLQTGSRQRQVWGRRNDMDYIMR